MNNDRPPASKLRKWLMGNKESTLPGLNCEKSGGLYLAEPGLTAGWLAGRQAGWLADKIWARLEILNACCRLKYSIFCFL